MKKFLAALVLSFVLSTALALEVSSGSSFTLTASDGTVVGVGELDGDTLELDLLAGVNDFAQLSITDAEGNTVSYEVMINSDGTVTLTESFTSLDDSLAAAGITMKISYTDDQAELQEEAQEADEVEEVGESEDADDASEEGDSEEEVENDDAAENAAEQAQEAAERAAEEAEEAAELPREEAERAADSDTDEGETENESEDED